jgi:hypothetical protein
MFMRLLAASLGVGGLLILLVGLLANVLGRFAFARNIGIGQDPGFGGQQAMASVAGAVILLAGVWLWRRQGASSDTRHVEQPPA